MSTGEGGGQPSQVVNDAELALHCLASSKRGQDGPTWVCAAFRLMLSRRSTGIGGFGSLRRGERTLWKSAWP